MKTKNKKPFLISISVILISLLSSCSQNIFEVADRYKVAFWFDEENSRALLDDGADTLNFYINGQIVATSPVDDIFWTSAPSCDDSDAISTDIDLLPKNRTIQYSVKDQTGFIYFSSTYSLSTNTCNSIKIGPITKFK